MELRWFELLVLFFVLPVGFALLVQRLELRGQPAPVLWVLGLLAAVTLLADPSFERARLWQLSLGSAQLGSVLLRFAGASLVLFGAGRYWQPDGFLWLPRKRPVFWLLFLLLYPPLSVVPQSLVWRVFFVHRYAGLLGDERQLLWLGAAAFAVGHLAFWNVPAMVMAAVGGALFLDTYLRTRSLVLSAAEHTAYGFVVLTAGLGKFLYRGRPRRRS